MKRTKMIGFAAAAILLMTAGIGGTVAYLSDRSQTVVNTFQPGEVQPEILEEFDGTVKEQVRVKNDGNSSAFVRVAVIVNWKDEEGALAPEIPIPGVDYTLEYTGEDWEKLGSYYYCLQPVAPGEETPVLIREVRQRSYPEGYSLTLEILAQSIQAEGQDAEERKPVQLAWGVDITDGNLIVPSEEADR